MTRHMTRHITRHIGRNSIAETLFRQPPLPPGVSSHAPHTEVAGLLALG